MRRVTVPTRLFLPRRLPPPAAGLLLLLLLLPGPGQARDPGEFLELARQGAPGLALRLMDRHQPAAARDPLGWARWEQARLDILARAGRWEALVQRVEALPEGLPPEVADAARLRQARALLELGRAAEARAVLRRLLWDPRARRSPQALAALRRLVAQSYLAEGRLEDARIALRRYRQDYPESTEAERLLQGRVLLRAGEPAAAAAALQGLKGAEARALALLAGLRAGTLEAEAVRREAETEAAKPEEAGLGPMERARWWLVAAEAAGRVEALPKRILALEQALRGRESLGADQVFRVDGEALWAAYLAYGQRLGNQRQLLIGDDAAWLEAAAQAAAGHAVVGPRSYYAVVALMGLDPAAREQAHRALTASLLAEEGGREVVAGLYLDSQRFPEVAAIPHAVRYELADYALARGDAVLASRLLADLAEPPAGLDPFQWQLRRARVLILGGREDAGIDVLYSLLAALPVLDRERADRLLQVVFDLQTVKRHEAAINLFVALGPRLQDPQQQRELLYWEAESFEALGQYEQAAWRYLRSAVLLDPNAYDPWAQTCRFHAAEALARAGLVADARRLYQDLLRATAEPERRIVLRHRLQQLQLQQ